MRFAWNYHGRLIRKWNNNKWRALCQFAAAIERHIQSETRKKKVFFHQGQTSVHKSAIIMANIQELQFELVPYFPDMAGGIPKYVE